MAAGFLVSAIPLFIGLSRHPFRALKTIESAVRTSITSVDFRASHERLCSWGLHEHADLASGRSGCVDDMLDLISNPAMMGQ
jgi:hypothetical protein